MTRSQKILNFIFGVAVISGAPVIAFLFLFIATILVFRSVFWWNEHHSLSPLAYLVIAASVLAVFIRACVWRRKHSSLSNSTFIVEIVVGAFIGCLFIFIFLAGEYAAYHAEWG